MNYKEWATFENTRLENLIAQKTLSSMVFVNDDRLVKIYFITSEIGIPFFIQY